MAVLCSAACTRVAAFRRTAMQQHGHAVAAARLSHRVASTGSAYFGKTLRPHIVFSRGLQLTGGRQRQQLQVQAAIFGVGAPEAILVGVVALLVFGPKGLAQAAKSLGSTLRAFQPTIRELTQVSAELKSTLENEIGINEIKEELRRPVTPSRSLDEEPSTAASQGGTGLTDLANEMTAKVKDTREDMARLVDPDIERKRAESAQLAWGGAQAAAPPPPPAAAAPAAAAAAAAPAAAPAAEPLDSLSLEQLEAELQRRKAAAAAGAQQVPKELKADD